MISFKVSKWIYISTFLCCFSESAFARRVVLSPPLTAWTRTDDSVASGPGNSSASVTIYLANLSNIPQNFSVKLKNSLFRMSVGFATSSTYKVMSWNGSSEVLLSGDWVRNTPTSYGFSSKLDDAEDRKIDEAFTNPVKYVTRAGAVSEYDFILKKKNTAGDAVALTMSYTCFHKIRFDRTAHCILLTSATSATPLWRPIPHLIQDQDDVADGIRDERIAWFTLPTDMVDFSTMTYHTFQTQFWRSGQVSDVKKYNHYNRDDVNGVGGTTDKVWPAYSVRSGSTSLSFQVEVTVDDDRGAISGSVIGSTGVGTSDMVQEAVRHELNGGRPF